MSRKPLAAKLCRKEVLLRQWIGGQEDSLASFLTIFRSNASKDRRAPSSRLIECMAYIVSARWGAHERNAPEVRLRELLASLDVVDDGHPAVSVRHASEWCLGAFPSGLLVWENVEDRSCRPRHMKAVAREKVLELWLKLAAGDLASIEAELWQPGYY